MLPITAPLPFMNARVSSIAALSALYELPLITALHYKVLLSTTGYHRLSPLSFLEADQRRRGHPRRLRLNGQCKDAYGSPPSYSFQESGRINNNQIRRDGNELQLRPLARIRSKLSVTLAPHLPGWHAYELQSRMLAPLGQPNNTTYQPQHQAFHL